MASARNMFSCDPLAPMTPRFLVAALSDKPQNPILRHITKVQTKDPASTVQVQENYTESPPPHDPYNMWRHSYMSCLESKAYGLTVPSTQLLSWSTIAGPYQAQSKSPFLSEQRDFVVSAASQVLNPSFNDGKHTRIRVTELQLLQSLRIMLLGFNSPLFRWDPTTRTYSQHTLTCSSILLVDGQDELLSQSLLNRLIHTCSMIRRIDSNLSIMRASSVSGPTSFAFCYSVSIVLAHITRVLLDQLSLDEAQGLSLFAVWREFETPYNILSEIEGISGDDNATTLDTQLMEKHDVFLLSAMFSVLQSAYSRQLPASVKAILAYILSESSRPYLKSVCRSLGMIPQSVHRGFGMDGANNEEQGEQAYDTLNLLNHFPCFFQPALTESLIIAQRSLQLLWQANPDHPMLRTHADSPQVYWIWSREDIENAWNGRIDISPEPPSTNQPIEPQLAPSPQSHYPPQLKGFRIFDLEPGCEVDVGSSHKISESSTSNLREFILKFPETLPPITPTLQDLASVVFAPLLRRSKALSTEPLRLFLSPDSTLNLRIELRILRSYMLISSFKFKSRLTAALFSDESDIRDSTVGDRSPLSRYRRQDTKAGNLLQGQWPVGLSPALLDRDMWPPNGADLSFFLRTVVSSQDEIGLNKDSPHFPRGIEARIGFAIRDLPIEGQNGWLNPCCIEALDFLYMIYTPPKPFDVLLTPEVLYKYQRLFVFLLRVLRVEHSITAVFRMTRQNDSPLFPTLTKAQQLLMHFRYVACAFISTFSQYLFDIAIGANFDAFLIRLNSSVGRSTSKNVGFQDVFAIGDGHSLMLDDVLSACLLRSAQRSAGDVLHKILELILDFAIAAGQVKLGICSEYEGSQRLELLFRKFCRSMTTLIEVVKTGLDADLGRELVSEQSADQTPRGTHGIEALQQLLLRIDYTGTYSFERNA